MFCWPCILIQFFLNNQLDAQFLFCTYLFQFSTCFEQPCVHHQESQLYQYVIWYMSLCGDGPVCRFGWNRVPSKPAYQMVTTYSDIYQISYWYSWLSWWWTHGCSKHAENWNKHIQKRNWALGWLFKKKSLYTLLNCILEPHYLQSSMLHIYGHH